MFFISSFIIFIQEIWHILENIFRKPSSQCLSVNYHYLRECNYSCKFCFHTNKPSEILKIDEAKRGLRLLKEAGMKKINFAGGEPFLKKKFLNELIKYCKITLKLESVSIISNGSLIDEEWFKENRGFVDILGLSCDSFNRENLKEMGRVDNRGGKDHLLKIKQIAFWCRQYKMLLKINTVVTSVNYLEDMNEQINELQPFRWKVLQCLLIEGENWGEKSLRDATKMVVSQEKFDSFIERHKKNKFIVPESNKLMKDSYLILDEEMRFLNCKNGKKEPSESLLVVGVQAALNGSGFDAKAFYKRKGKYNWRNKNLIYSKIIF